MMDALKKSDGADTGLFSRYTMAGWVFLVVLAAAIWQRRPDIVQGVYGLLTIKDASGVAVAVVGVIAGLATAPAFGFVLATAAEGLWTLIDGVEDFPKWLCRLIGGLIGKAGPTGDEVSEKWRCRVAFYAYGDDHTIALLQQHQLQCYASLACALAILFALAVAWLFQALSPTFGALGLFIGICLIVAFVSQIFKCEQIRDNWYELIGKDKLDRGMRHRGPPSDIVE